MIDRAMVEEMFSSMREDGIDANEELLWGYYFVGDSVAHLERAIPMLEEQGFEFVEIFEEGEEDEDEDEDEACYVLHVERIEAHTVDSLDQLNQELAAFAEKNGIGLYDGVDVGVLDEEE